MDATMKLKYAPWKKRQHIKNQKHKYGQSCDFSSSHPQMWELDHREGWALKNWCFDVWCWRRLLRVLWTTRRSKQSILKELWIFNKMTDAEVETLVLDPDAGKDWRQKKKRAAEDEIASITNSMDMNLSKLWETVKDRGSWHAAVHGFAKNWTQISKSMTCAFFSFFQQHLIVFRVHVFYLLRNVDF